MVIGVPPTRLLPALTTPATPVPPSPKVSAPRESDQLPVPTR